MCVYVTSHSRADDSRARRATTPWHERENSLYLGLMRFIQAPYHSLLLCSFLATASACGGGGADDDGIAGSDGGTVADAGVANADAGTEDYTSLITGTWTKGPGSDSYWCTYLNIEEDMYITGLQAIAPLGTHHTVLSVAENDTGPNREEACGVNTIAEQLVYASGVGTDPYDLPEGVAMKLSAGQTLQLQLHLFNVSDQTLEGTSGISVKLKPASEVENIAEFVFAGTFQFAIPGDGTDHTASGRCTIADAGTIFTLWPHMHQVGKHMTISHNGEMKLDTPYDFNEQRMYPVAPFAVAPGDSIDVGCTWNNPQGNATKFFGDASNDEMCFGGFYRYPATGSAAFCTQ